MKNGSQHQKQWDGVINMSIVHGFKIGTTGLEFSSLKDRTKAINDFVQGNTVKINSDSSGLLYSPQGDNSFGTYERDTDKQLAKCYECSGIFPVTQCSKRNYQYVYTYNKSISDREEYICNACLIKKQSEVKEFLILNPDKAK